MTPTGLLRLLALASICTFTTATALICGGCTTPDPVGDDEVIDTTGDDDDDALPTECTVEASTYIEDAIISAEKPDGSHTFDDCLAEELDEEERSEEDAAYGCSMVAPANVSLVISAFAPNAVGCDLPVTLAAAETPHEEVVPLGYGEEATHGYDLFAEDGTFSTVIQIRTYCEDGKVIVNTELAGRSVGRNHRVR